jgi:hypothetical protein
MKPRQRRARASINSQPSWAEQAARLLRDSREVDLQRALYRTGHPVEWPLTHIHEPQHQPYGNDDHCAGKNIIRDVANRSEAEVPNVVDDC